MLDANAGIAASEEFAGALVPKARPLSEYDSIIAEQIAWWQRNKRCPAYKAWALLCDEPYPGGGWEAVGALLDKWCRFMDKQERDAA